MALHDIELELPATTIVRNADAIIKVHGDGELIGTLEISRGSIDWRPRRGKKVRRLTWERFDRLMRDHGTAI
ncbi:MAG: hypothetical protein HYX32_05915 [Actinobacteria bacterium]|nr:hypothetical protein [Actinomycetota bacterium]